MENNSQKRDANNGQYAANENDKRFDRGKQVLTTLIGVLGTIVGFHFGSASSPQALQVPPSAPAALTITMQALPAVAAKQAYPSVSLAMVRHRFDRRSDTRDKDSGAECTPLSSGNAQVTVTVTDSSAPARKVDKQLQLEVKSRRSSTTWP
jgi:hypothetical protein